MSIIETDENALLSRRQRSSCCQQKQYFNTHKSTLVDTLQILPRVIIYKKPLKVGKTYETLVSITNQSLHSRRLIASSDSDDITINIYPKHLKDNFLEADKSLQIGICLQPTEKVNINRRRHVVVQSEHPNITFTIPIIILIKNDEMPSLPKLITFPTTSVKDLAFYEMILYNKSLVKLDFTIKCNNPLLTILVAKCYISRRDYIRILLKLNNKDTKEIRDVIKLKFGADTYEIPFEHQPIEWAFFIDTMVMQFDLLKFNRSATKSFRICNESSTHTIKFDLKFMPDNENLVLEETYNMPSECGLQQQSSLNSISASSSSMLSLGTYTKNKTVDAFPWKHFQFEPKCGTLAPNASMLITVTFKPIMHLDFNPLEPPPFRIATRLIVSSQDELKREQKVVAVQASITGPDIDVTPKITDLHNVFFGEEHCALIEVANIDGVTDCHVDFYDFMCHDEANVIVTPKDGFDLKPCERASFHLQFFAKVVGKFMVKLQFKVRCGSFFSSLVRGYSQHVRVKCFPDVLELGTVPVCVPQKRLVLLMNPLTVPISVQCTIPEDGNETPLVLNVINVDEHLPIHVKDPVYYIDKCVQQEGQPVEVDQTTFDFGEAEDLTLQDSCELSRACSEDVQSSLLSYHSVLDDNSSYSTEFQEQALDHVTDMAPNLLNYLKKIKVFDKPDVEKNVIEEALNALLKTPYFCDMEKYKNYCNMDWNSLPSDAKEIYCNNEIFYLTPNTGKAISVVVIPNTIGRQHKYIAIRVCPILPPSLNDDLNPNLRQVVDSEHLISKLWVEYNCSVPELMWDNVIDMQDPLYCGELYEFEMIFENCSNIGGFFYYEAIPDNELGCMRFLNDRWKYFVEPGSIERVPCAVEFKKTGNLTLLGLIKFVGVDVGFPFHIKSMVLPPKLKFTPHQLTKKLTVLELMKFYVFIDNATPTTTWFRLKLKDDSNITVYPEGAQLAPTGQGIYATLEVFYKDPGTYRTILYLIMQHETIEKIPITLHVEGMPIFLDPELRHNGGLHIGYVLCNTENEYNEEKPNYTKLIKVTNKGERHYRIVITKTKSSAKPMCSIIPIQAKIYIKPSNIVIDPMSQESIVIATNACEEGSIYNEFRVDVIDGSEPTRKQSTRFVVTANFILPQLDWNRREIVMEYHRTHKCKEREQWEMLNLINVADNLMELVMLKVTGPFVIKEQFEGSYVRELQTSLMGLETKELFVMLDKNAIRNRMNTSYEGRIFCWANGRVQKSVHLKVKMFIPSVMIVNHDIVLFAKNVEGGTYVQLHNPGPVPAIYKWKKLQEEWHYINEEDDSQQVAEIILSDIIRTLDLEPLRYDDDSEPNMTKRYHKHRCHLHQLNDPINIRGMVHEIIDHLDLEHKRYQLVFQETPPPAEPKTIALVELLQNADMVIDKAQQQLGVENMYDRPQYNQTIDHMQDQIDKAIELLAQQQHEQFLQQFINLEEQLNSKTLFFNRKFHRDPSSEDASDDHRSSSETCVHHTLDHIVGHLKLDDSFVESQPSSDTCQPTKSVYFYEKCGILQEHQREMCALHIPAIRKGFEVRTTFQLDVVGGKTQILNLTLVNLDKTLKLNRESVYLGLKPWYETFQAKVKAENITKYHITLDLCILPTTPDKLPKLAIGYIKILNEKLLHLEPLQSTLLKTEGIMGFGDEFIREIRITVNDGDELQLRLRGHGVMPMITAANHNLPYVQQDVSAIEEEYRLLQKIYYFEIFKAITEIDEELNGTTGEENEVTKALSYIMELSLSSDASNTSELKSISESSRSTARHDKEMRFFRILQSYVLVNNNEELPNATVLDQLLQTEKFLNHLRGSEETCELLHMVYQAYLRYRKSYDEKLPINLKHFTTQPLPFQLRGYILDMHELSMNQYHKFVMTLEFFGPGKLIASARSVIRIPGLIVDFRVVENTGDKDFMYCRCESKLANLHEKPYRNMSERIMDTDVDPKLKHAHSYDLSLRSPQHQRDASAVERKWLMSYYDSLNKSVYVDRKHHCTHCKIFTNCKYNFTGTKLNIILLIRPQEHYYQRNQTIEDYLYVDLHMGPTLPILLRGTVVSRDKYRGKETSVSQKTS